MLCVSLSGARVTMKLLPPGFIFPRLTAAGSSHGRPLSTARLAALVTVQLTFGVSQLVLAGVYGEDCPSMSRSIVLSGLMFVLLGLFVAAAGYATQRMEGADSSMSKVRVRLTIWLIIIGGWSLSFVAPRP